MSDRLGDSTLNLSPRKRELLDQLLRNEALTDSSVEPIRRRETTGSAPLSFAQQRLWFLDRLVPANPFYNVPMSIQSDYPLNVQALKRSMTEIVRRHESLRTTFAVVDGQPVQEVGPAEPVPLQVIDLSTLPQEERESRAAQLAEEEARTPFDLEQGPLLRCTLLRLGPINHVFLLTMHHIVSDGWSIGLLSQELTALYQAYVLGRPSPLAELPVQYADYAVWQRQRLQGELLERQLEYWRRQLKGISSLELPTDRPRPAVQSYRGASTLIDFPSKPSVALRRLGQSEGCTPFMTFLAGFQCLLSSYSGQEDVVVGVPVAGRDRAELEPLIGFFVNTLVMRGDLSGNPSFRELLRRVRKTATEAYAYQELPFEKLVDELQPERDLSRNPLFQVTFQLFSGSPTNTPVDTPHRSSADAQAGSSEERPSITGQRGTSVFDLGFNVWELQDGGLSGYVEYSTDLYDAETVERLVRHWQRLLESAASNPDAPLGSLSYLDDAERRQLLVEWNQTSTDYPREASVHELFQRQADATPDAVAVSCGQQQLTYRELSQRAVILSDWLRQRGADSGHVVAVSLDRSVDLIVCLLGVLRTGAAYLPLDPGYPPQRLASMLEDAEVSLVLTERAKLDFFGPVLRQLPSNGDAASAQVVCLADVLAGAATTATVDKHDTDLQSVGGDQLAYVMYTSGSTGRPKGTCIPHRAIVRLARNCNYIQLTPQDTVAQASSISFDAATFEIWGALLNGAQLAIVSTESLLSAETFREVVRSSGINVLFLTTALFNQLARQDPTIFKPLKYMLFGGEAVDADCVREVCRADPPEQLLHVYGPTENTTFSTWYPVETVAEGAVTVPLGQPISNTRCYVLDTRMEPVPVGALGELFLGGDGLAKGYLKAPELTAEKFVPDPFADDADQLVYRTGDVVRRLPNGDIVFVGRSDNQIKIRGFRVELAEVESGLALCPGVQDAVVTLREDAQGEKRLVAYIVGQPGNTPGIADLRQNLLERLPGYMVPSVFVFLDELPLNASGKVDRRVLPAPSNVRPQVQTEYVEPATPTEELLAEIWAQVLRLQRVGIHDNFFELGGDSILSVQIIGRAKQAGLNVSPPQIFQHQTIAELAKVAGGRVAVTAEQDKVSGPVSLTPVQHWFFEHDVADPHHFNQAALLDAGSIGGADLVRQSLESLVEHHDALRLRFEVTGGPASEGGGWSQMNAAAEEAELLSVVDLSDIPEEDQGAALEDAATQAQASLDLAHGPLLRAVLFRRGSGRSNRLLIAVHHLAIDGISWRILLEDLQTAWQQLVAGKRVQLPLKTTSFQYWAQRLAEHARTPAVRNELNHWMKLAQVRPPEIPLDFPESALQSEANTVADAKDVMVMLDAEVTRRVLQDLPAVYRTQVNDVLLTALYGAIRRWTGNSGLLIDLEGHGREAIFEDIDLSRTVGWFTTVFPVYLDVGTVSQLEENLKLVKEQLRQIPNRGIGFGLLRYLSGDRQVMDALRALPTPQISFNYLGQFVASAPEALPEALERSGDAYSPRGRRFHCLEINGSVQGGRLQFTWTFSQRLHRQATIQAVADDFIRLLTELSEQAGETSSKGHTPSDFSKARISQRDLDNLLTRITGKSGKGGSIK